MRTRRRRRRSSTRKRTPAEAKQDAFAALFSSIVALSSIPTAGVAGPGWAQKKHEEVERKEKDEKNEEEI